MAADTHDKIRKLVDGLSISEISDLIRDLESEREHRTQTARDELLQEMEAKAASIGLSARQLVLGISGGPEEPELPTKPRRGRKPGSGSGKPSVVRYRSPDGATWTGKGRQPGWLKAAEAEGRSREEFAVAAE